MKTNREAKKQARSGMALLIATAMAAGALTGCGNSTSTKADTAESAATEETAKAETTSETTTEETTAESMETTVKEEDTAAATTEDDSDFATVVSDDETDKEPDPIEVTVKDLTFEVPGYYTYDTKNSSDTQWQYSYESSDTDGAILILSVQEDMTASVDEFRSMKESLADSMKDFLGTDMTVTSFKETEYLGMPGYAFDYEGSVEGYSATADVDLYLDDSSDVIYVFGLVIAGEPTRDVKSDYIQMMKNASWTDGAASGTESTTKEETTKESTKKTADDGKVSADVKKVLDSYESLMNDYCDFMVKYQSADSSDALAMLDDYYSILDEYTKAMDELNSLDTSTMSTADYEYYLDVTNRVSKRLLEVSGS